MKFETWMAAVDIILTKRFGMTSADMPDWCWWDLWDENLTPSEAIADYLENEGYFV
jgi:hypothetical protein